MTLQVERVTKRERESRSYRNRQERDARDRRGEDLYRAGKVRYVGDNADGGYWGEYRVAGSSGEYAVILHATCLGGEYPDAFFKLS